MYTHRQIDRYNKKVINVVIYPLIYSFSNIKTYLIKTPFDVENKQKLGIIYIYIHDKEIFCRDRVNEVKCLRAKQGWRTCQINIPVANDIWTWFEIANDELKKYCFAQEPGDRIDLDFKTCSKPEI